MKIKTVTVATHENQGLTALKKSAAKHGMDLTVLGMGETWRGFGMKIIKTVEYLKTIQNEYTHFIFVDAYDTLFLKPITTVPGDCILFSTEKQKWPDLNAAYPPTDKIWAYLNSGVYMGEILSFLHLIGSHYPVSYEMDDQRFFTDLFLKVVSYGSNAICLDTDCEYFQSYAFEQPGDFTLKDGLVQNNITKTIPAIIHFNGRCHVQKVYNMTEFQSLAEVQSYWRETLETHKYINEKFIALVNDNEKLKTHRDFVENHAFGFGERSFHWMWNLIVKEMPMNFIFLEIGVLKGQVLSLCELLAQEHGKKATRFGITPLNGEGGVWPDEDYGACIKSIHDTFNLEKNYEIFKGLSEDEEIIKKANKLKFDILYIDGGHETRHIKNDVENYAHLVKNGGYLVVDDCCNSFHQPFGYFQGIQAVSNYIDEHFPPATANPDFEFVFSVVHNRVYRRL